MNTEADTAPAEQPKELSVTASRQEIGQFGLVSADVTNDVQGVETRNEPKVGRNEECPCGSGKKFKNCGLKNTEEHQKLMAAAK
jgi:uncharacterized protein YecA (UPF0149 family)